MTRYLLDPQDESPHRPSAAPNYNESVYVNAFDFATGLGGWMRLGNRPNEGHAELAVCLYLPDGRIACSFQRPAISSNQRFAAGGFSYSVVSPLEKIAVDYGGELMLVDDPQLFRNPKQLFAAAPRINASLRLECTGISPVHGGLPESAQAETMYGREFSLGHFYQHVANSGTLTLGSERFGLNGFGWRDHSWGPRTWQNIRFHRLLTAVFDDGSGFCLLKIANRPDAVRRYGVILVDGDYEDVVDFDLLSDWNDRSEPERQTVRMRSARTTWEVTGSIKRLAPLRNNKREGGELRSIQICEGITEWSAPSRRGFGMSEFGDLLVNGRLAGFPL